MLNKQIASEVGAIIDAVQSDNLTGLSGSSDNLLVLMNTKQIATGKQENYHDAIELIEAEEAYFQGQIQEEPETISSPKQGYFMRTKSCRRFADPQPGNGFEADIRFGHPQIDEGFIDIITTEYHHRFRGTTRWVDFFDRCWGGHKRNGTDKNNSGDSESDT